MEGNTNLATIIQSAMKAKQLSRDQLAGMLGINYFMVEKLLRGEIMPSTHLKQRLLETLQIPREKSA